MANSTFYLEFIEETSNLARTLDNIWQRKTQCLPEEDQNIDHRLIMTVSHHLQMAQAFLSELEEKIILERRQYTPIPN